MKILVVGAGGSLGRRVTRLLLSHGVEVRAASRNPGSRLRFLEGSGAETIRLDLRDGESIERGVDGVDRVFAAAHGFSPPDRHNTVLEVDERGNRALVDAARSAGVEHFLLMSIVIAGANAPTTFGRAKHAAEQRLRESGLSGTIVRSEAFMEAHVLGMLGEPLRTTGKVQIFGQAETPLRFVATEDVARIVTDLLLGEAPDGVRLVEVMGPEAITRLDALRLLERALDRPAKQRRVPVVGMRAMRAACRLFNPPLGYIVEAGLAEETSSRYRDTTTADERAVCETRLEKVVAEWAEGRLRPATD